MKYKVIATMADGFTKTGFVNASSGEQAEMEAEYQFPGCQMLDIAIDLEG